MKIAFLGSRGIPARYSGFETFYEQLATRLVKWGHDVTVYNRARFIKDVVGNYEGVRIVSLPSIPTKHLDTITHTFLSTCHALFGKYDIVYYCIVGNSPLVWIPRLFGARTLLNVDGEDWAREKWSGFARWYQKRCERVAARSATVIIADAEAIRNRYRRTLNVDSVFVPYGANILCDEGTEALEKWGLSSRRYMLFVGRLVPENAIEMLIRVYRSIQTDMKLVILGDAPYVAAYKRRLRELADERVVFTGYAFGRDYAQLSSHAYLYVHPSSIEGTRPALLDQMGFGNCVVVRGSEANREVTADCGYVFRDDDPAARLKEALVGLLEDRGQVEAYRARVHSRIETYYNWDWVTAFYEDLFARLLKREHLMSYDDFLRDFPGAHCMRLSKESGEPRC